MPFNISIVNTITPLDDISSSSMRKEYERAFSFLATQKLHFNSSKLI